MLDRQHKKNEEAKAQRKRLRRLLEIEEGGEQEQNKKLRWEI